jgi:hypothetical protein
MWAASRPESSQNLRPTEASADQASAELLRVVGALLDAEAAREAAVHIAGPESATSGPSWVLSWRDATGCWMERAYAEAELVRMRDAAQKRRYPRSIAFPPPVDERAKQRAELLRTLGQELDREGVRLRWLRDTETGLRVAGRADAGEVVHYFGRDELCQLSRHRQFSREAPAPRRGIDPLAFFHRRQAA